MDKKRLYRLITIIFFITSIIILSFTDLRNNVKLSISIQIILILYLCKISYGCLLYIKKQYQKKKYSYSIVMNLGLFIFLTLNIFRQINLLIQNWNILNIVDIYNNTLKSFSYFAMIILPFIIILCVYSALTNIFLIKKEGFYFQNLLGFIFSILIIVLICSNQTIYIITDKMELSGINLVIKRFVDVSLNAVLSYLYCLILATLYCNIMAAKHKPKYDKDFIIILGSQIRKDGTLTPLLKGRADKAISFGAKQKEETNKDIYYVPSGGRGEDEVISEGDAIKNYLLEKGIDKKFILVESKSKNTLENMRFSKAKIDKINKDGKILFSTTNYHVFRSGVIASNEGIDCEGIGSKTKWYFYTNALIREFIANIVKQKKEHLFLILSIIITLFILVMIGYSNSIILDVVGH